MKAAVLSPVDLSAIKSTGEPWISACLRRDWDALLSLCTEDIVFMPPDEPIAAGNQVRPWLENYPVMRSFELEFDHIEGQEGLATARGHFKLALELPGAPTPISVDGKFLDTFRKDGQGKWRYAVVAWNSNLPSPLRGAVATTTQSPLQATGLEPGLTVNDLAQSIKLFEGLGFVVSDRWEEAGVLLGVMLRAGAAQLGLSQDDWKKGRDRVKGVGFRTFIQTNQSVDDLATRAAAAGVVLGKAPYDTPWGSRAFEVTTPEGFVLTISTPMK